LFHGSAVRFTAMARKHQRVLREWLRETQRRDSRLDQYLLRTSRVLVFRPRPILRAAA
jgi:hypothetical protein